MPPIHDAHGKGRVRVTRVAPGGEPRPHAFDRAPLGVGADDRGCVATDEPHGRIERRVGRG